MRKTLKHKRKARNKAGVGENRVTIISDYSIVEFHTNLIRFKNALQSQNIDFKITAKTDLLRTIPEGQPASAFLNRPGLIHNITELRTLLSGNFEYPERFSAQYNHLLWLLNETTTMVRKGLDEKGIEYPLIPQRGTRAQSSPRDVMDLPLGLGKRTRRMRRNRRRS